jgi:asparagine synthase (glutamine-hydrolysing)
MTWIGGIVSKANMSRGDLRGKMALMMETACPADRYPAAAYPRCASLIFDEMHGWAIAKVSRAAEGIPGQPLCSDGRGKVALVYDGRGKVALVYDGHLYDCQRTGPRYSQPDRMANKTVAEAFVNLLGGSSGKLEQKVRRALASLDGDYAMAVSDTDHMVISRDSLGTKPLYLAESSRFSAFASNKKPLWKIGLREVRPLRAGKFAILDHEGVGINEGQPMHEKPTTITTMVRAVNAYQRVLKSAVAKRFARVGHVPRIGVLLSGGVDSCLMAKLILEAASSFTTEVVAYTAGLRDSPDVKFARKFARELDIRHNVKALSISDVEEYIPGVIEAIEDSDFVQVETGIGLYAALDLARQDGIAVLFSGQGPDELWGGYNWYPRVLARDGRQELCLRMWDDFTRADIETLDRENKIALAHDVELLFPYLDVDVVNLAMSVASELKVTSGEDHLGKHPHRQLAIKMGVSGEYANRRKSAIQHGTGIHGVLDAITRKNGFDPALVKDIGYSNERITTEKMGSSSRYGYRYIGKAFWEVPQHVQLFFHAIACRQGLLDKSVRERVGHFLDKARLTS